MSRERKLRWTFSEANQPDLRSEGTRSDPHDSVPRIGPGDIDVVFQPIVDLDDGHVFAHEALTRCKVAGFEDPSVLFNTAAAGHFAGRLGRTVRDELFARCGDVRVFVNLHPAELASRWIVRPDDPMCFHTRDVYLEITEAAAFEHHDLCGGVLKEVCARTGAKLVIDDFGAGYSNLLRIVDLEPHIVKLDRELIRGIHTQTRRQALVRHVLQLCIETGSRVVAEGIELQEELEALRDIGVHYGQGYLLARPAFPLPKVHWPF